MDRDPVRLDLLFFGLGSNRFSNGSQLDFVDVGNSHALYGVRADQDVRAPERGKGGGLIRLPVIYGRSVMREGAGQCP